MNCIVGEDEMDWNSLPDEIIDYSLHEKDLKNNIKVGYKNSGAWINFLIFL